jgi:hypothetical protein
MIRFAGSAKKDDRQGWEEDDFKGFHGKSLSKAKINISLKTCVDF